MRAILFSEWSIVRASFRQYILVTAIMALAISMGAVALGVEDAADAASRVNMAVVPTVTIMLTFFVFFALFGADEREGWETARLALPVSRNQVVSARYVVMLAALLASTIVANIAGILAGLVFTWIRFGAPTIQPLSDIFSFAMVMLVIFTVYLAVEMPIFFKWGLEKARPYFNIPALVGALLLLPLLPLFEAFNISISDTSSLAQSAGELTKQLGSSGVSLPIIIVSALIGLGLAAGACALSIRVSRRVYACRDF